MANEDLSDILAETRSQEQSDPFSVYAVYLLSPALLGLVVLLILKVLLPPPLNAIAHWLSAFLGGVFLAALVLLALIKAWLKGRVAGLIATGLAFVGWTSWALLLPKAPLPAIPKETSGPIATLLAIFLPLMIASLLLLAGLYLVAGYLLPVAEKRRDRRKVFNCLIDHLMGQNYPFYVMADEPWDEDKLTKRGGGSAFSQFARGPGLILTRCDHAVAVSDGTDFKGVQGPGLVFTSFADRPVCTLDLRPQIRLFQFQALTQDGIQIEVPASVIFQIDSGGERPRLGAPFPFRRSAAARAILAQEMEPPGTGEEKQQRRWDELPQIIGTRILQDILSRRRFDELYGPYDIEGEPPRQLIIKEYQDRLRKELRPLGIYLISAGIGNILPVRDEVLEQRVRIWRADWTRRVILRQARSQAERLQRIERARAEARTELILTLGERIAELSRANPRVPPEAIVSQFLEVLEQLAVQPALRRYVPPDALRSVRQLRKSLGG